MSDLELLIEKVRAALAEQPFVSIQALLDQLNNDYFDGTNAIEYHHLSYAFGVVRDNPKFCGFNLPSIKKGRTTNELRVIKTEEEDKSPYSRSDSLRISNGQLSFVETLRTSIKRQILQLEHHLSCTSSPNRQRELSTRINNFKFVIWVLDYIYQDIVSARATGTV